MSDRQLCSIEKISDIRAIDGADQIEQAQVKGWNIVVKKGDFSPGDTVLYIEVDAALPLSDPRFEFLGSRGTKRFSGEIGVERDVHVLKTARLRGVYSQGIVFRLADFPEVVDSSPQIQPNYDGILGIEKWEPPLPEGMDAIGPFPSFLRKTDAERVQNIDEVTWAQIQKEPGSWIPFEKIDGSSLTCWKTTDGPLHVSSRNWELDPKVSNSHWRAAYDAGVASLLQPGEWMQAEVAGPGVQGNPLSLDRLRLFVFGFGITNFKNSERLPIFEWPDWAVRLVPPIIPDMTLPKTIDETVLQVESFKSVVSPGRNGEGIVWSNRECEGLPGLEGRHIFKSISAKYLMKHDR